MTSTCQRCKPPRRAVAVSRSPLFISRRQVAAGRVFPARDFNGRARVTRSARIAALSQLRLRPADVGISFDQKPVRQLSILSRVVNADAGRGDDIRFGGTPAVITDVDLFSQQRGTGM